MTDYERSNKIESVELSRFSKKEYKELLSTKESIVDRQKAAQHLITYLCNKYNVDVATVRVVNRAQPYSMQAGSLRSKKLGTYTVHAEIITIYNLTSVKKQIVSIKTFAGTLLHEFIHHYDITYLKLDKSLHTAGFYKRISDLEKKLK